MKEMYFDSVVLIERLHRLFLEVLKVELDRLGIRDINNVQCLVLYNIGKNHLTVGELTQRGYYLGSNVSYNLKKMVGNDYITQEPSLHDKRSSHVRLSEKGLKLYAKVDKLFEQHAKLLDETGASKRLDNIQESLAMLDQFWGNLLLKDSRRP
jgi:DNA-binding MarR family transcriptional regulator